MNPHTARGQTAKQTKTLWVREPWLAQILAGRKTIEVRVGYDNILRLQPGDQLTLNDEYLVTIRRIGQYAGFEELLAHEDPTAIAPDLESDELLAALRQIYPQEKEALGAFALEVVLPRRYEAVLFDMGYTLIYFEPPTGIIVQEALRAAGAERSVAEIEAAVRVVWGDYYRDAATVNFPATPEYDHQTQLALAQNLLAHFGLDAHEEAVQAHLDSLESWFGRPGVIRPYPEVVAVLETLTTRGYRLGIVSNWSWNLRERVAQAGLDGHFEIVWASAYAGCNKPHPGIFHHALARMEPPQVSLDRVLYVGDSYEHDVVGARNAGVDVALLDRDGTATATDCPVIRDLRGIFDLLD
jgi:HAD superfamily hydrolase (TIGR01662 family)